MNHKKISILLWAIGMASSLSAAVNAYNATVNVHALCAGDVITTQYGTEYTKPGTYMETLSDTNFVFHIVYWAPQYVTDSCASLTDGSPIGWHGREIYTKGTHTASDPSHGCRSYYRLLVCEDSITFVDKVVKVRQAVEYPYVWEGDSLWTSGIYYHYKGKTQDESKDSVLRLNLTIHPLKYTYNILTACPDEEVKVAGQKITKTGIYKESLKEYTDKDVILYTAVVLKQKEVKNYYKVLENGSYYWDISQQTYTTPGQYIYVEKDNAGCVRVQHVLNLEAQQCEITRVTRCKGDSYTWKATGLTYIAQGQGGDSTIYYHTTKAGEVDAKLILYTNPTSPLTTDSVTMCEGTKYEIINADGSKTSVTTSGTYQNYLSNTLGCDSVIDLSVVVKSKIIDEQNRGILKGQSYRWIDGKVYNQTGTYEYIEYWDDCDCPKIHHKLILKVYENTVSTTDASFCDNSSYEWKWMQDSTEIYNVEGRYTKTYTNSENITFTYILNLTKKPTYDLTMHDRLCNGEPFITGRGEKIYFPRGGTYDDVLKTVGCGCDSIIHHEIYNHIPDTAPVHYAAICQGDAYEWRGQLYSEQGIYYDRVDTNYIPDGCYDSIYVLNLKINPVYYDSALVVRSDQYVFNGQTYTQSTIIRVEKKSIFGCDSITVRNLIITKRVFPRDTIIWRCEGYSVTVNNETFTTDGDKFQILDVDSIFKFKIQEQPTRRSSRTITLCQSEMPFEHKGPFDLAGVWHNTPGTFVDKLISSTGCDSIVTLTLYVNPTKETYVVDTICPGHSVWIAGKPYSEPCVVRDSTFRTNMGCDSIIIHTIVRGRTYFFPSTQYVCKGDSAAFHRNGQPIKVALPDNVAEGYFYDSCLSVTGCDSVYSLHLITADPFYQIDRATICPYEKPYIWLHGNRVLSFMEPGVYYDSLTSQYGCDSIYKLELEFYPEMPVTQVYQHLCQGNSIFIGNKEIFTAGTYYDTLTAQRFPCDSVIEYHISMRPTYYIEENNLYQTCLRDTLKWHGKNILQDGVYFDSLKTVSCQCDSVYSLKVRFIQPDTRDTSILTKTGLDYEWKKKYFTRDTTWSDTLKNQIGCDSIIHYDLHFTPHYREDTIRFCHNEYYYYKGEIITEQCVRRYVCDRLVGERILHDSLEIITFVPQLSQATTKSIEAIPLCADNDTLLVRHEYESSSPRPFMYDVDFSEEAESQGFRDQYDLEYPSTGDTLLIPVKRFQSGIIRPGQYALTIVVKDSIGCSEHKGYNTHFEVHYPSYILKQLWNNVVAVKLDENLDQYQFRWFQNNLERTAENKSYLGVRNAEMGTEIFVEILRPGDSLWVASCPITLADKRPTDADSIPHMMVGPSQVPQANPKVVLTSDQPGQYHIYSATGMLWTKGYFEKQENEILLPSVPGFYLLFLQAEDGYVQTEKIRVE